MLLEGRRWSRHDIQATQTEGLGREMPVKAGACVKCLGYRQAEIGMAT